MRALGAVFIFFSCILASAGLLRSDLETLKRTYALGMQGFNKGIRFASVIIDNNSGEFVGRGSWNRLSRTRERAKYCKEALEPLLPENALSLLQPTKGMLGALSLDVSVHAEQGALIDLFKETGFPENPKEDLERYSIFTIGLDDQARIGVALKREWTCYL